MHEIWATLYQAEDLSWDISMQSYGQDVILSAFASASEALAELISLYPDKHIRVEVMPFAAFKGVPNE
jgi:hypothetical protein